MGQSNTTLQSLLEEMLGVPVSVTGYIDVSVPAPPLKGDKPDDPDLPLDPEAAFLLENGDLVRLRPEETPPFEQDGHRVVPDWEIDAMLDELEPPPPRDRSPEPPPIIGLMGGISSGKDTAAAALESIGYQRRAFADRLKEVVAELWNLTDWQVQTQEGKASPVPLLGPDDRLLTVRDLLEDTGENLRQVHPNVWVDYVFRSIERQGEIASTYHGRPPRFVIPDVRYPNEVERIRAHGGVVWRVERTGWEPPRRPHVSDEHWREIVPDAVLENPNGQLEVLAQNARDLARRGGRP